MLSAPARWRLSQCAITRCYLTRRYDARRGRAFDASGVFSKYCIDITNHPLTYSYPLFCFQSLDVFLSETPGDLVSCRVAQRLIVLSLIFISISLLVCGCVFMCICVYMCVHVWCAWEYSCCPPYFVYAFVSLSGSVPVYLLLLFTIVSHIIISNISRLSNIFYSPLVY